MAEIEAHPDAAIFPMMSTDELADLAADIKENGQRFPIVIGKYEDREVIVDGRNRYAACEIAGIEPKFEKLNGHDPKAFILSVNVKRRHMTASQRAMAVALIYPDPTPLAERSKGSLTSELTNKTNLSMARTVLRYSTPLAEAILAGSASLAEAYEAARLAEGKLTNETIRLRQLRDARPDLAERVVQADITLDEAVAQDKREKDELKQRRWAATKNLIEGVQLLDRSTDTVADLASQYDPTIASQLGETITPERLLRVAEFASCLAVYLKEKT